MTRQMPALPDRWCSPAALVSLLALFGFSPGCAKIELINQGNAPALLYVVGSESPGPHASVPPGESRTVYHWLPDGDSIDIAGQLDLPPPSIFPPVFACTLENVLPGKVYQVTWSGAGLQCEP